MSRSPERRPFQAGDARTDEIARHAASLLSTGQVHAVGDAIRMAAEALGHRDAPRPRQGRVRRHVQAMTMQALGSAGYAESVRRTLGAAEQVMAVFAELVEGVRPVLVGRAARGLVDGPVTLHIRLYTSESIEDLARIIIEHDCAEPAFETIDTRYGRLSRMRIAEPEAEIALTRCLPAMAAEVGRDLFTGRPIDTLDLAGLRALLESSAG